MENQHKRKKYFLRDSSQIHLIIKTYLVLLFVILISGVIFYFIGNKSLSNEFYQAHSTIKKTMELLLPNLILVNFIGLLGAFMLVIVFTHAIAGPVYKIKQLSQKILEGDLTITIKFRKGDLIHELATIINQIIKEMNSRFKQIHASIKQGQKLFPKIEDLENLSKQDLIALKKDLIIIHNNLNTSIDRIKL